MKRTTREYLTARYVAQEARKDMRAGDFEYAASNGGTRFHSVASLDESIATIESVCAIEQARNATPAAPIPSATPLAAAQPGSLYAMVHFCRAAGLTEPVPEYQFHPTRHWRFDYAWPLVKLALEVEGGIWTNGRHTRGAGALADLEKYSEAAIAGWRVIYCTPTELATTGFERVRRALA